MIKEYTDHEKRIGILEYSFQRTERALSDISDSLKKLTELQVNYVNTSDAVSRAFREISNVEEDQKIINKDIETRIRLVEEQMPTLILVKSWIIGGVITIVAIVLSAAITLVMK